MMAPHRSSATECTHSLSATHLWRLNRWTTLKSKGGPVVSAALNSPSAAKGAAGHPHLSQVQREQGWRIRAGGHDQQHRQAGSLKRTGQDVDVRRKPKQLK